MKAEQLKPSKLVTADTFWPVERTTNRPSLDTAPCVSLSSQWGYATMPQLTADRSTTMLDIAGFMSSSVACYRVLREILFPCVCPGCVATAVGECW